MEIIDDEDAECVELTGGLCVPAIFTFDLALKGEEPDADIIDLVRNVIQGDGTEPLVGKFDLERNIFKVVKLVDVAKHLPADEVPTQLPTTKEQPVSFPTLTSTPTLSPINDVTLAPTVMVGPTTDAPTRVPTQYPSTWPSATPKPTSAVGVTPIRPATPGPSAAQELITPGPTPTPTLEPSRGPSESPSSFPTLAPSKAPTPSPTSQPSKNPSSSPSKTPSRSPSSVPSTTPSGKPTPFAPSADPSESPSMVPSSAPSICVSTALELGGVPVRGDYRNGRYLLWLPCDWEAVFGSLPPAAPTGGGYYYNVKQMRDGVEVWQGEIVIWFTDGSRPDLGLPGDWEPGRRNPHSSSADGDWITGDLIVPN